MKKKPARKPRAKMSAKRAPKKAAPKARRATQKKKVSFVAPGYRVVTPHLVCRNTSGAIEFYKKAFGAREVLRMTGPDGSVAHAEIQIGDSRVMMGDEMPQMGASAPQTVGGSPVHLLIYTKDVDKLYARAVAAGATGDMPPTDMFWGDRYGKLTDPFGHKWSVATHIEDVGPKETARRAAEEMAKTPQP